MMSVNRGASRSEKRYVAEGTCPRDAGAGRASSRPRSRAIEAPQESAHAGSTLRNRGLPQLHSLSPQEAGPQDSLSTAQGRHCASAKLTAEMQSLVHSDNVAQLKVSVGRRSPQTRSHAASTSSGSAGEEETTAGPAASGSSAVRCVPMSVAEHAMRASASKGLGHWLALAHTPMLAFVGNCRAPERRGRCSVARVRRRSSEPRRLLRERGRVPGHSDGGGVLQHLRVRRREAGGAQVFDDALSHRRSEPPGVPGWHGSGVVVSAAQSLDGDRELARR